MGKKEKSFSEWIELFYTEADRSLRPPAPSPEEMDLMMHNNLYRIQAKKPVPPERTVEN